MLSELQGRTAQAIINIFETSKILGDYSLVVCVVGDAGGLTYGKAQTTINSGNLYLLIKAYVEEPGADFADELRPYLNRVRDRDSRLCNDTSFKDILRQAGKIDDVMIEVQDAFFDRVYWQPAVSRAERNGITTALGTAVVYDSTVHGSWVRMRDRTNANHGNINNIGEQDWVSHYVTIRRAWLASFLPRILGRTTYRMDAFRRIINAGNWDLELPLNVRGLRIDEDSLIPPINPGPITPLPRFLRLDRPFMTGPDVVEVQQALLGRGFQLVPGADGIFGPSTEAAVKAFQSRNGLTSDGIVGPVTRAALGIDD